MIANGSSALINAYVISIGKENLYIKFDRLGNQLLDLIYKLKRPEKDSQRKPRKAH